MNFVSGQKVVCVDDSGWAAVRVIDPRIVYPVNGAIYTIRQTLVALDGESCCRLKEIKNPKGFEIDTGEWAEPFFASRRFRPVVEKKTDISIFKKILTPAQAKKANKELV